MYILWKKILRSQGYIKRLDFIYYNNIILYISDNTNILSIPPMNTTHTTLKKFGGTELISVTRSLRISPFYYIRVLFNRWHRVVLCTIKNLLGESAEPGNVLFSRTCFFFLNSIETWEDKVHLPQLHTDADFRRKVPVHVSWHTVRWYLRALQQIDTEEVLKRTAYVPLICIKLRLEHTHGLKYPVVELLRSWLWQWYTTVPEFYLMLNITLVNAEIRTVAY
jgi:hypothetical protein